MKRSLTYFIAAGLFALAASLNVYNEGLNLKTGIGLVFVGILIHLGLKSRRGD
jgi:hypothetical protein